MKKLMLLALLASPSFADTIEVVAHASNQSIKARDFVMVNSSHIVNVKNTSNALAKYMYLYCTKVDNDEQCYSKIITLKPGASFNDHDRGAVGVSRSKGQYRIIATTKVNDVVNEAHAILTVS